jgi:hypothetical protein
MLRFKSIKIHEGTFPSFSMCPTVPNVVQNICQCYSNKTDLTKKLFIYLIIGFVELEQAAFGRFVNEV